MSLAFLAAVWIAFLVFLARTKETTHQRFLLAAWGVMILGSIIGVGQALF